MRDRSVYYEAELIHNLWPSLWEPEMTEHDIWFLNVQAKTYYDECDQNLSPLYSDNVERIKELFGIVPEQLKSKLKWTGPK